MDVQTGIGTTEYAMVAVALAFIAYPTSQALRILRSGLAGTRGPELIFLVVVTLVTVLGTIPASLLNVGWILVPLLVVLVSLLYAAVFAAVVRAEGPVSKRRLLAFVVPLAIIAAGSAAESALQQQTAARIDADPIMLVWVFWSIVAFTVLPPIVAILSIVVIQSRARSSQDS